MYKGKGKKVADPASYRPVSILPAMSKILENIVMQDLSKHLSSIDALPTSQCGFRPGRSTVTAIAKAHAAWTAARMSGLIVGVLAFDLSAAFDTVSASNLLPKLAKLGVTGRELAWFASYLSGGEQVVVWNGSVSAPTGVKFGVRQGSMLGPLLYLVLVADMPDFVEVPDDENSGYADDTALWATGTASEVKAKLEDRAARFVSFANANGLILNASKTQLLLGAPKSAKAGFLVNVDGVDIAPSKQLELLGVTFDDGFSVAPHMTNVASAARSRANAIARLALHVPRGPFLSELARGIFLGKVGYAAAATTVPRLCADDATSSACAKIQIAMNDVARTITGSRRQDHVRVPVLLHRAGLCPYNELVVRAAATETWKAYRSRDGPDGSRNPLGTAIFGDPEPAVLRRATRALTAGEIPVPNVGKSTLVASAARLWNASPALRAATGLSAAKSIAAKIARASPT